MNIYKSVHSVFFNEQNLIASHINKYMEIHIETNCSILANCIFKKIILLYMNPACINKLGIGLNATTNKPKHFAMHLFNNWMSIFHYPFVQTDKRENIYKTQFDKWFNEPGINNINYVYSNNWDIFQDIEIYDFLGFVKSVQYYLSMYGTHVGAAAQKGVMNTCVVDNFIKLRDNVYSYLLYLRGYGIPNPPPGHPDITLNQEQRKQIGIGYLESRLPNSDENAPGWTHSGSFCKINQDRGSSRSIFTDYINRVKPGPIDDLPVQCGISGSTNALLSTILWGTSDIILTQSMLSEIILGIISLLVLDGGHTIQEGISAVGIVSNYYFVTNDINSEVNYGLNRNSLNNLYNLFVNVEFLPKDLLQLADQGIRGSYSNLMKHIVHHITNNVVDMADFNTINSFSKASREILDFNFNLVNNTRQPWYEFNNQQHEIEFLNKLILTGFTEKSIRNLGLIKLSIFNTNRIYYPTTGFTFGKRPIKRIPMKVSPKQSPIKRIPVKRSPVKLSPVKRSPVKRSPVKRSPVTRRNMRRSRSPGDIHTR